MLAPSPSSPDAPSSALPSLLGPWFAQHARALPWRAVGTSAWAVLVSEVMSQQTPVARVAPLWQQWMRRWPSPASLAQADPAEVLRMWANLGYPRRALRLRECAQAVVDRHDGELPTQVGELLELPGVGSYTARAVAAFALEQAVPVVDTNVRRVYRRVVDGEFLQGPARARDLVDVAGLLPYLDTDPAVLKAAPGLYEQRRDTDQKEDSLLLCVALMELGALVCTARSPQCDVCPLASVCRWVQLGKPEPSDEQQQQAARRVQKFEGTDRQVRGKIMAVLRNADVLPVPASSIDAVWPDKVQLWRAADSLVADGLMVKENQSFSLPSH